MSKDSSPALVRVGRPVTPIMSPRRMMSCAARKASGDEADLGI